MDLQINAKGTGETTKLSTPFAIMAVAALLSVFYISMVLASPPIRYVATTGSNSGDCTVSPCLTITYAIGQANSGDTIQVAAGTYNEQVTINKDNLVVQSTSGAESTIITPTDTTNGGIVFNSDGNTFTGFTIQDFTDSPSENKVIRINSDDNIVQNNIIQGNLKQLGVSDQTEYGILFQSTASGNLIDSNEIYDIGYMGINVAPDLGTSSNTISNNNVHDIGIYAIGVDRSPSNTVTNNQISNLLGGTLWGDYYDPSVWCWGVIVWGAASTGTIIDNQDLDSLPNGIALSSAVNVTVKNSEIKNTQYIGIRLSDSSWIANSLDDNIIQYNKIYNNNHGIVIKDNGYSGIGLGNTINWNDIEGNEIVDTGLHNYANQQINATYNYWGCPTGPGTSGCDTIIMDFDDTVVYDPFLCVPVGNPGYPEICAEDEGVSIIVKLMWGLVFGDNDADTDGISDSSELSGGLNPINPDTDGDGICDGTIPFPGVCDAGPYHDKYPTNPDGDTDGIPGVLDLADESEV